MTNTKKPLPRSTRVVCDTDAAEIGAHKTQLRVLSAARVTDKRKSPAKISRISNADACHHCQENFKPGQMRYPAYGDTLQVVSICMDCFKAASDEVTTKLDRYQRRCQGCGEPMLTPFRWQVCSNRCYQRAYRERRRGRGSVVAWKGNNPRACAICHESIDRHKRQGSKYCSNACRQMAYRRRVRQ